MTDKPKQPAQEPTTPPAAQQEQPQLDPAPPAPTPDSPAAQDATPPTPSDVIDAMSVTEGMRLVDNVAGKDVLLVERASVSPLGRTFLVCRNERTRVKTTRTFLPDEVLDLAAPAEATE